MTNRQIWPEEIQPVERLDFRPVDSRYIKVLAIRTAFIYIILMAGPFIASLIAYNIEGRTVIAAECLLASALIVNMVLIRRIYNIMDYALREKDISYRKGLIFTSIVTIPFCKIQQVDIRMGPISRTFGLCRLDIFNGSQATGNHISIPGLPPAHAEQIKMTLIDHADHAGQ